MAYGMENGFINEQNMIFFYFFPYNNSNIIKKNAISLKNNFQFCQSARFNCNFTIKILI